MDGTFSGTYEIPSGITKLRDYAFYRSTAGGFIIPDTITQLGAYCFGYCCGITSITIPDTVLTMDEYAFYGCSYLSNVTIGSGLSALSYRAFCQCPRLQNISIPGNIKTIGEQAFIETGLVNVNLAHGIEYLENYVFAGLSTLTALTIPNTLNTIKDGVFSGCENLTNVTIENGFNANKLDLSVSTKYSAATIVSWLNALADRTNQTAYTLKIGSTNINKLTAEQIAIATNKNWNLA